MSVRPSCFGECSPFWIARLLSADAHKTPKCLKNPGNYCGFQKILYVSGLAGLPARKPCPPAYSGGRQQNFNEIKTPPRTDFCSRRCGDPAGIRTPDPLLKRQLLCRLSYRIMRKKWLGRLDSNQRMRESKSLALPLGYAPRWKRKRRESGQARSPSLILGWVTGLEPATAGTTIRCSTN